MFRFFKNKLAFKLSKLILWFLCILIFPIGIGYSQTSNDPEYKQKLKLATDLQRLGQDQKALDVFLQLLNSDPQNIIAYRGAKQCYIKLGKIDDLEELVRSQMNQFQNIEYRVDLGELYYRKDDKKAALNNWEELVEAYPDRPEVYQLVGRVMTSFKLYDEAIKVYLSGRKSLSKQSFFVHELVDLYIEQAKYEQAINEYIFYLEQNPQQYTYVENRIANFASTPEIIHEIENAFKKSYSPDDTLSIYIHKILAAIYQRNRDWEHAFQHYQQLEKIAATGITEGKTKTRTVPGNQLFVFAASALQDKAYPYAQKAYNLICEYYPNSPLVTKSQYEAAHCLELMESYEEAIIAYQHFLSDHPNTAEAPEAMFRIGEIYFHKKNDTDRARIFYNNLIKTYPGSAFKFEALFRLADCELIAGQLQEPEHIYQKISVDAKDKPQIYEKALLKHAQVLFYGGQFEESKKLLDEMTKSSIRLKGDDASVNVNDALELALLINENLNEKEMLTQFAEIQFFIKQRKLDMAKNCLEKLVAGAQDSPIFDDAVVTLGKIQRQLGDYKDAIETFTQLLNRPQENNYQDIAQWQIAEIYEQDLKDLNLAQKAYEDILSKYPYSILLEEARAKARYLNQLLQPDT